MSRANESQASVFPCPCQEFASIPKILDVLESKERTRVLLDWLDGKNDELALNDPNVIHLSCGKRCRCRFRFGISFAILNSLRDAVRPYLDKQPSGSPPPKSTSAHFLPQSNTTNPPKHSNINTYEESFPSLGSADALTNKSNVPPSSHPAADNILKPPATTSTRTSSEPTQNNTNRNHSKPKKKVKRRIRPQLAGSISGTSTWGNLVETKSSSGHASWSTNTNESKGNIASLSSKEPVLVTPVKSKQRTPTTTAQGAVSTESESGTDCEGWASLRDSECRQADTSCTKMSDGDVRCEDSVKEVSECSFQHLVDIYTSLIMNSLVPSTALELHLLLRLLTVHGDDPTKASGITGEQQVFFKPVFASPHRCRSFASMALNKLATILTNLGAPLLKGIVECQPFRSSLPDLAGKLDMVLQNRILAGFRTEYPVNSVTGSHAMMTLPFEHKRDSRHNFKSPEEVGMYKNRENTRDSFLYQLRAFIEVRKGNLFMSPQGEVERALEKIRVESRNIIQALHRINMAWFAQLFCDLLLQIGLAPMEETDKELLSIAGDKEKLQVS